MQDRNLVFVVDDDSDMLKGLQRLLRQRLLKTTPISKRRFCVVLDINLNDGSGIELRNSLKAAGNDVPIIYMTGNDSPAIREAALASGCIAFLEKPFSAQSLIEPLKKATAGRS